MLEFIVLGQIPGTHLQITLAWFALLTLGLLIYGDVKFHKASQNTKTKKRTRKARA